MAAEVCSAAGLAVGLAVGAGLGALAAVTAYALGWLHVRPWGAGDNNSDRREQ